MTVLRSSAETTRTIIELKHGSQSEMEWKNSTNVNIFNVKQIYQHIICKRGCSHNFVASWEGQQKCLAADDPTHLLKLLVLKKMQTRKRCFFAAEICMDMQKILRRLVSSIRMAEKYARWSKRPNFEPKTARNLPEKFGIASIRKICTDHPPDGSPCGRRGPGHPGSADE